MSMKTMSAAIGLLIVNLLLFGCSNQVPADSIKRGQIAFDEAIQLLGAGKHADAKLLLDQSIASGGLAADQLAEALLYRAQCHAEEGNMDLAQKDLEHAEQGSPNQARYLVVKGSLLRKQGKKAESDAAFREAKRNDKSIKLPK